MNFFWICEVFQVGNDPDHLLLTIPMENWNNDKDDDYIINGAYFLSYARTLGKEIKSLGLIKRPYKNEWDKEHYNDTLLRFRNGERVELIKCECCEVESWKDKQI